MVKNIITTALIFSSSLITTACRTDSVQGVLVGRFADEEPMVSAIAIPPAEHGDYRMHYALHQGDGVCLLTGRISDENVFFFSGCEGVSGIGKISCNDGRALDLQWTLTSCQGGYGRSIAHAGPAFFFGFEQNEQKARGQLEKAQQENEHSESGAQLSTERAGPAVGSRVLAKEKPRFLRAFY